MHVELSEDMAGNFEKVAAVHGVAPERLVVHVLEEYLRLEKLASLRSTAAGAADLSGNVTTWADQLSFFHARLAD